MDVTGNGMPMRHMGLAVAACIAAFGGILISVEVVNVAPLAFLFGAGFFVVSVLVLVTYGFREYVLFGMTLALALLVVFAAAWLISRPFV